MRVCLCVCESTYPVHGRTRMRCAHARVFADFLVRFAIAECDRMRSTSASNTSDKRARTVSAHDGRSDWPGDRSVLGVCVCIVLCIIRR